ncbi:hypothetical protein AGMMS50262_04910 [Bacteroidia bacterium]|nr:hypothetical protein AGMMS50262_04910 [Bacteroidia bacterium]
MDYAVLIDNPIPKDKTKLSNNQPLPGYITLEQLRTNALIRLKKLYEENGLLKQNI